VKALLQPSEAGGLSLNELVEIDDQCAAKEEVYARVLGFEPNPFKKGWSSTTIYDDTCIDIIGCNNNDKFCCDQVNDDTSRSNEADLPSFIERYQCNDNDTCEPLEPRDIVKYQILTLNELEDDSELEEALSEESNLNQISNMIQGASSTATTGISSSLSSVEIVTSQFGTTSEVEVSTTTTQGSLYVSGISPNMLSDEQNAEIAQYFEPAIEFALNLNGVLAYKVTVESPDTITVGALDVGQFELDRVPHRIKIYTEGSGVPAASSVQDKLSEVDTLTLIETTVNNLLQESSDPTIMALSVSVKDNVDSGSTTPETMSMTVTQGEFSCESFDTSSFNINQSEESNAILNKEIRSFLRSRNLLPEGYFTVKSLSSDKIRCLGAGAKCGLDYNPTSIPCCHETDGNGGIWYVECEPESE